MADPAAAKSYWTPSGEGVERRVLADNADMMTVEFRFREGGIGAPHSHPHVQSTFVGSGRFEFTVGGETRLLGPGDSLIVPSNAVHSCKALEAGNLIDTFAPRRDDFL